MAKKWSTTRWVAVGAGGLVVVMFVMALAWVEYREHWRVSIQYTVDLPSTPVNGGWADFGPDPVLHLLESDPAAGVLSEAPTDPIFRGVIVSGPDLPGNGTIEDYRIVRDGYYVEFADGAVRYVLDPAPWLAIRDEVESGIGPHFWQVLVNAGAT